MTKFFAQRDGNALRPTDDAGREALAKIKPDQFVLVDLKRPRNPNRMRFYWSLINKLWENQSTFATPEALHETLKCATGYCIEATIKGRTVLIPKSISFDKMTEADFSQYLDRILLFVSTTIIPRLDKDAVRQEVAQMCGVTL